MCETNANPIYHRHPLGIITISPNAANETVPADDRPSEEKQKTTRIQSFDVCDILWFPDLKPLQFYLHPCPMGPYARRLKLLLQGATTCFAACSGGHLLYQIQQLWKRSMRHETQRFGELLFAPRTQELKYQRIWINCIGFGADVRIFTNKFRTTPDFQTDWQSLMNTND